MRGEGWGCTFTPRGSIFNGDSPCSWDSDAGCRVEGGVRSGGGGERVDERSGRDRHWDLALRFLPDHRSVRSTEGPTPPVEVPLLVDWYCSTNSPEGPRGGRRGFVWRSRDSARSFTLFLGNEECPRRLFPSLVSRYPNRDFVEGAAFSGFFNRFR